MLKIMAILMVLLLFHCTKIPQDLQAVEGFELQRYLGTWYEIARLDHRFERGLENITANYEIKEDGEIRILNRGYNLAKSSWKTAIGKAFANGSPSSGRLKVSFFGPFYASYNIIALDKENYSYAVVCGPNKNYFWILSRYPQLPENVLKSLIEKARSWGFKVEDLIYVSHQKIGSQARD